MRTREGMLESSISRSFVARAQDAAERTASSSRLWWRRWLLSPIWPLLVALLLYSVVLPDDLFGDEFDEYKFSVLGEPRFGMSTRLDVHTQLARLGYTLVGQAWAIRLYSVVCALGTIVLVRKLARLIWGDQVAVAAMWVAALSPYLIEFAGDARPNSIFVFAGTLFFYALVLFVRNESWRNALFVACAVCFGLLAREMFVVVVIFGMGYYVLRQRKITFEWVFITLCAVPFVVRQCLRMLVYSQVAPKESAEVPVSALNFLARLPMAFTFGFCTLKYPHRETNFSISIRETLLQNQVAVVAVCIVLCGLFVGLLRLLCKARSDTVFLTGAIVVPVSLLLLMQEIGFSILNVRHCAGVLGVYCVLLAGIFVDISKSIWGRLIIGTYICLIGISLYHFYCQPEIYSRRSNYTALNSYLLRTMEKDDCLLTFNWNRAIKPHYLTAYEKVANFVDLLADKPDAVSMTEYIETISADCTGRLYLVDSPVAKAGADPDNRVLSFLKEQRPFTIHPYGRNLSLYVFAEVAHGRPNSEMLR